MKINGDLYKVLKIKFFGTNQIWTTCLEMA